MGLYGVEWVFRASTSGRRGMGRLGLRLQLAGTTKGMAITVWRGPGWTLKVDIGTYFTLLFAHGSSPSAFTKISKAGVMIDSDDTRLIA
jgi:hypothetical protein